MKSSLSTVERLVKRLFKSGWSQADYWQQRFEHSDTPWELGHPSHAFVEALERLQALGFDPRGASVVISGCGRGSDALELARRRMQVTALDWSPSAIQELRTSARSQKLESRVTAVSGDFFATRPEPRDAFAEHTFFCAIDPSRRSDYARLAAEWVRPGGWLFGNFFILDPAQASALPGLSMSDRGEGPPFASTRESLIAELSPWFDLRVLERATQPEPDRRPGMEWVGIFQRRMNGSCRVKPAECSSE